MRTVDSSYTYALQICPRYADRLGKQPVPRGIRAEGVVGRCPLLADKLVRAVRDLSAIGEHILGTALSAQLSVRYSRTCSDYSCCRLSRHNYHT